jgi:predicted phosphodiesterase
MRIALISDLHGNAVALGAVLADVDRRGVDATVCLGDTATLGPAPAAVLATLRDRAIPCITGNHDAFLLDPALVHTYTDSAVVVQAVDWCRAELPPWALDFVRTFVPGLDYDLGGGATLRLFHGTPRSFMENLLATTPDDALDAMLGAAPATVMAGGHTHVPLVRRHRTSLIVNPGSVGMPFVECVHDRAPVILPFAEYAIVAAAAGGVEVTLHRVALDRAALHAAAVATSNPLGPVLAAAYA